MTTQEKVLQVLQGVQEPVSKQDMVSLQWIRDMVIKPGQMKLTILIAPQVMDTNEQQILVREIKTRLHRFTNDQIHIRVRLASEVELNHAGIIKKNINHKHSQQQVMNRRDQHEDVQTIHPMLQPDSPVTFISVTSGKGGVGKSTITANLAVSLARRGKRVGLIDADIYGFSIPAMMGIEVQPSIMNHYIIPAEKFGVKVMSMGFFVTDNSPVVWRGPLLGKMLRNFFQEVQWGQLDYMLFDLPPGTGDIALDIHRLLPHSREVIVTTPHDMASFVAVRAGTMAVYTNHDIIGVIENMSYLLCDDCGEKQYLFGRGGGAKLAQQLHVDLLAQIPLGIPDNQLGEPDYAPSIYKETTFIGKQFSRLAMVIDGKQK